MNKRYLIGGFLVIIPLIALLVLGLGRDPSVIDSPLVGKPAPRFDLEAIDSGERVTLESLAGRPAVINFWASWCVPCYQEHPVLERAARRLGDEVSFVGIIYQDSDDRIRRFLADPRFGPYGPSLKDPDGRTAIAWGVYGVPETFFLDSEGRVVAKHTGPLTEELLTGYLSNTGEAE